MQKTNLTVTDAKLSKRDCVGPRMREFNSERCYTFKVGFLFLLPPITQNKCSLF